MSYKQFSENLVHWGIGENFKQALGSYQPDEHIMLEYIDVAVYKESTPSGDETFTMTLEDAEEEGANVLFTSNSTALDSLETSDGDPAGLYFLGYMRFTFDKCLMNFNTTYWLKVQGFNYTPNFDTNGFAVWLQFDWPEPTYIQKGMNFDEYNLKFQVFGKEI